MYYQVAQWIQYLEHKIRSALCNENGIIDKNIKMMKRKVFPFKES